MALTDPGRSSSIFFMSRTTAAMSRPSGSNVSGDGPPVSIETTSSCLSEPIPDCSAGVMLGIVPLPSGAGPPVKARLSSIALRMLRGLWHSPQWPGALHEISAAVDLLADAVGRHECLAVDIEELPRAGAAPDVVGEIEFMRRHRLGDRRQRIEERLEVDNVLDLHALVASSRETPGRGAGHPAPRRASWR